VTNDARRAALISKAQTASFVFSAVAFLLAYVAVMGFFGSRRFPELFFAAMYLCLLLAVGTTTIRYLREQRRLLPKWRRLLYGTALILLVVFCFLPLITWPLVMSGQWRTLHLRPVVLALFGAHLAAAILVWFGRGWSRLGLTFVNYWLFYLWMLPIAAQD